MSVERIFLDWSEPALPAAAARLAATYAAPDGLRMEGVIVAVPGSRAGRRLNELLLDEAAERRIPLVPPRMATAGALPDLLIDFPKPAADTVLATAIWGRALRDDDPVQLGTVFPGAPTAGDLVGWSVLAGQVHRLHRAVAAGGHDFASVARVCREGGLLHDDHDRWETLARVQARYRVLLDRLDRSDADLVRLEAIVEGWLTTAPDVWLVSVVDLSEAAKRILIAGPSRVRAFVHAPETEGLAFDEIGLLKTDAWSDRPIDLADSLRIADRPSDQAAAVAAEISRLGGGYSPEDIAVAVPDADLVPYVEQRLEAAGVPTRYGGGLPLPRTAPYRLLHATAEYLGSRDWEALAALWRHPDLPITGRTGRLTQLDRYHTNHLPARLGGEWRSLAGESSPVREAIAAIERRHLLGRLTRGRRRLSEWQTEILGFLAEAYGSRTLSREVPEDRRLIEVLELFRAAAVAFHSFPAAVDEICDAAMAIRLLLEAVRGQTVAEEPGGAAVELLGWLEMHLDDAPVAIVTGFNEPHLPESVSSDSFLPDRLRARLGIADNASRYARDAYLCAALLQSRERVRFIAGRFDAAGDALRPGRLMLACRGETLARRVRAFTSAADRPLTSPAGAGSIPGPASRYVLPPEPELHFAPPVAVRVTDFRGVLEDPYRFALERILNLRPLDDSAREMDGLAFGSLAHDVLQAFGHTREAGSGEVLAVRARLDILIDDEVGRRFGNSALPAVAIQVEQLRARLHAFAAWQAGHIRDGWRVVMVEGHRAGEASAEAMSEPLTAPFIVDQEPILIRGRVDRIDHRSATGEWLIIDYKTGDIAETPEKTHRTGRKDSRSWKDLQLPLYRHLVVSIPGPRGGALIPNGERERIRLAYVHLPRTLEKTGLSIAEWSPAELESADDTAREVVRALRRGVFTFDAERAARHGDGPLAPILGLRQLAGAGGSDEDDEDDEGSAE